MFGLNFVATSIHKTVPNLLLHKVYKFSILNVWAQISQGIHSINKRESFKVNVPSTAEMCYITANILELKIYSYTIFAISRS